MSNMTWRPKCDCCGRPFRVSLDSDDQHRTRCGMCSHRGGLCMHNVFTRVAEGGESVMHSSRPHRDDSGAADPRTCRWCLARL